MSRVLVFDIWGNYAHFRKPYTTTSPLTYSIPSRTVLTGIIGAILGIPKGKNNTDLNYSQCNISIRIMNPVKKVIINQNLINTKTAEKMSRIKPTGGRTQIRFETLKDVRYRIYAELLNLNKYEILKNNLMKHSPVFSLCLGITEHIADFLYIGEFTYLSKSGYAEIDSVINLKRIQKNDIIFEAGKEYFSDTYALEMKEDREVLEYGEILIERNGSNIIMKNADYIQVENGEKVIWM